ncbi:MAG: hypothetical protein ABI114_13490 [Rhodanobacter sp.]
MKILPVVVSLLLLQVTSVFAHNFCQGASFVPLDQLVLSKDAYLNKRVRTHAVLVTDAKEFSLLKQEEDSHYGLRTSYDEESDAYKMRMALPPAPPFSVVGDFFEKLRALEGPKYKQDMTKIRYYRQDVIVCGRVVKSSDGEYSFAIDDIRRERSYVLRETGVRVHFKCVRPGESRL